MTTNTMSVEAFAPTVATAKADRPGFFARMMKNMIAGRELQARRIVRAHLARHPDKVLEDLGWSREEIAALRSQPQVGVAYPL